MAEMLMIDLAGVQYYRIKGRMGWFFDGVGYPNVSRLDSGIVSLNTALDLIEAQQAHIARLDTTRVEKLERMLDEDEARIGWFEQEYARLTSLVTRMREALRIEHALAQGYRHRAGAPLVSQAHKFLPDQYDGAE